MKSFEIGPNDKGVGQWVILAFLSASQLPAVQRRNASRNFLKTRTRSSKLTGSLVTNLSINKSVNDVSNLLISNPRVPCEVSI